MTRSLYNDEQFNMAQGFSACFVRWQTAVLAWLATALAAWQTFHSGICFLEALPKSAEANGQIKPLSDSQQILVGFGRGGSRAGRRYA